MSFDKTLTTGDLNTLWKSALASRAVIRNAMIAYAVKMGVDESEHWKNPFRAHLDRNDASLLSLQADLTSNLVRAYIEENAPNLEVDVPTVMSAMVDALTDEDSETTTYDKPLVFDAQWVKDYLQEKYLKDKESIAFGQLVSRVYHLIGNFEVNEDGTIVIPFYQQRWFGGKKKLSIGTQELVTELDKLIQVVLSGAKASDVVPLGEFHAALFEPIPESSEARLTFMKPEDAAKVAAAILESHPHK